jgi:hypothetical protein
MGGNPRIKDMAEQDRPRERLIAEGAEALASAELVAILLRTGRQGFSAVDIARQLLAQFRTLDRLARRHHGRARRRQIHREPRRPVRQPHLHPRHSSNLDGPGKAS